MVGGRIAMRTGNAASSVRRVGVLSVHTSPLDRPGEGDGGGLNVYVREISRRLAERGIEVDVFTRRTDPSQPATATLRGGVQVHHIDAGPARAVPKDELAVHLGAFALALQRHPRAGTHDLLHAQYWMSGWVAGRVARRWGTPFAQTFHTLGVLKNATLAPGDEPEPALRLVAEERVARVADRILVLTCGEARLLHRAYGLSGAKIDVVPAGVDLDRFWPAVGRPAGIGDEPQLLFVGRLQPLKGPDTAVRTLAVLRRWLPGARLRIIGGASGTGVGVTDPTHLSLLAEELGVGDAVTFEDALDQAELADRYRSADLLLAPSRSETFGLVALEAQACGVPVVAADVPGLEAVVGAGGELVGGHDPWDHAAAALGLLTDHGRWRRASAAGVRTAQQASWERSVDRLLASFESVVAQHADEIDEPDVADVAELVG